MRLKEWIVRAEQTGHQKVTAAKEGNGRSKKERGRVDGEERTSRRGWTREGQIRVKKACLLWQSPRPSVLPCSTSCSKADLRGTQTSWSAQENKARLATPSKATKLQDSYYESTLKRCIPYACTVWAAEIPILEENQRTPSRCPGGLNQCL